MNPENIKYKMKAQSDKNAIKQLIKNKVQIKLLYIH